MVIEKNKGQINSWLKNKENLLLVAVILFAFGIRIYYFVLTQNQPLWWDEAEYMLKAKNIALGTPETGWSQSLRPILFPFLASPFFLLGLGEAPLRFLFVILSVASITLFYYVGKTIFKFRVGAVAAFLMSIFYIDIFYTTRLLVDVPQIFFVNLALFLFVRNSFGSGSPKLIWAVLPAILIGTQMRFTVGIMAIILFIFLIFTQGAALFKRKEWYISLAIGIACFLPYLIYAWTRFGNPFYNIVQGLTTSNASRAEGVSAFDIFMEYIRYFPNYSPKLFFIFFIVGACITIFYFFIGLDKMRTSQTSRKCFLLILLVLIPLIYFGFFVNHFEDRYMFMAFPAIFIITALAIDKGYKFIGKYSKIGAIVLLLSILFFGAWNSLQRTDALIKLKVDTYAGLRDAGIWIRTNSFPNESIVSAGMPEITYYSERQTYAYPLNESEIMLFAKEKGAKYMVLSVWERSPAWTYEWPQKNSDKVKVEQAFFTDPDKNQISAIIYSFRQGE